MDVKKELPVTLMFQPFYFSTQATRAFEYESDEMLQEASQWCLAIALLGLLSVILVNRKLRWGLTPHETSHHLRSVVEKILIQATCICS